MRTFNKILFVLKESFTGIGRNFSKTFIQFLVCFISLVFFGVVFGVYYNVQDAANNMKNEIQISVFIKDDATGEQLLDIESVIKNNSNVKSFEYISKEKARKKGEATFKDSPEMLEAIQDLDNPFPSSFNIELIDPTLTEETANAFLNMPGVEIDGVKFGEEYMDKILSLSSGLIVVSYMALAFFFVIAVFFIISIINIIIAQKHEESTIMFMIGASPIQIKSPFYIQGALIGLSSSSLAYAIFLYLYSKLSQHLTFVLKDISEVKNILLMSMILTGLISGLLATNVALIKFNRVSKRTSKKNKQ